MRVVLSYGGSGGDAGFGTGGPDASRRALADQFAPVLSRLGKVARADTARAGIRMARRHTGAVHFCLALPNELPPASGRETIPLFGLGLSACPSGPFAGDLATDWRRRLAQSGGAACFSSHAAQGVRALMGDAYPVQIVPPPVDVPADVEAPAPGTILVTGSVLDTATWPETGQPARHDPPEDPEEASWPSLTASDRQTAIRKTWRFRLGTIRLHAASVYRDVIVDLLPPALARLLSRAVRLLTRLARRLLAMAAPRQQPFAATDPNPARGTADPNDGTFPEWSAGRHSISLNGLVFAAVQGGWDRSWSDLLSAFVLTCRNDTSATLVVKTAELGEPGRAGFASYLRRLGPFACRVVILDGTIDGGLQPLIATTSFYLCASHAEASPLPMMRFMAAGRPAVAPCHSALADFVTPETSIVVRCGIEYESWPGDVAGGLGATGWRLDWESLCSGIEAARALAHAPGAYAARSQAARRHMADYCGPDAALAVLSKLLAARTGLAHDLPPHKPGPSQKPGPIASDAAAKPAGVAA